MLLFEVKQLNAYVYVQGQAREVLRATKYVARYPNRKNERKLIAIWNFNTLQVKQST